LKTAGKHISSFQPALWPIGSEIDASIIDCPTCLVSRHIEQREHIIGYKGMVPAHEQTSMNMSCFTDVLRKDLCPLS
jgi:hypothetical protein